MVAWIRDKKGSADIIQFVLILPIFVMLFYGFFEVWRVVSVKQSLDAGTYQAARYLSVNHDRWQDDQPRAAGIILSELENNTLLGSEDINWVEIYIPTDKPPCNELFTVRAGLELPWTTVIPYLSSRSIVLVGQHTGYIECGPSWAPAATPTPTPTPVGEGE